MSLSAILFSFKGRINRAKFWMVNLLLIVVLGIVVLIYGEEGSVILLPFGILCFWAGLAVTAKRWHDCDRSGQWILIALIPILGPILVFVVLGFFKGTDGPNRFGPDPLKEQ